MQERVAVDWKKLERIVKNLKVKNLNEEEEKWHRGLEGSLSYNKLKTLKGL